jgi:hypothetical protein
VFQVRSSILKKIIPLALVANVSIVYGYHSPETNQDILQEENTSAIERFLARTGYLTVENYYAGNLGTVDLFVTSQRYGNNGWLQLGVWGPFFQLGGGAGYRYLLQGENPYQDWFLGFYGYYGRTTPSDQCKWKEKNAQDEEVQKSKNYYNYRRLWGVGAEIATGYWQLTIHRYGLHKINEGKEDQLATYQEGDLGVSARLSLYWWHKMGKFGRINPIGLVSYTRLNKVEPGIKEETKEGKPWALQGGIGLQWELPRYVTLALKVVLDPKLPGGFLHMHPYIGVQINFTDRDTTATYAKHRSLEMPQGYRPSYSTQTAPVVQTASEEKSDKGEGSECVGALGGSAYVMGDVTPGSLSRQSTGVDSTVPSVARRDDALLLSTD